MFFYPATEVFSVTGERRVAWSAEEYQDLLNQGYADTAPEAHQKAADTFNKLVKQGFDPNQAAPPKKAGK